MGPSAPDDPLGSSRCPMMTVRQPLWIRCVPVQLLRGKVTWRRWEVKSQHSSSERLIKRCLHLSLWSWPRSWTSREEVWKRRWGARYPLTLGPAMPRTLSSPPAGLKVIQQRGDIYFIRCVRCPVELRSCNWSQGLHKYDLHDLHSVISWGLYPSFFWVYSVYPECYSIGESNCAVKRKIAGLQSVTVYFNLLFCTYALVKQQKRV